MNNIDRNKSLFQIQTNRECLAKINAKTDQTFHYQSIYLLVQSFVQMCES